MAVTSLDAPTMRAILNLIRERGQTRPFYTSWITDELKDRGHWDILPSTPENTINRNISQSPDVFTKVGRDQYRLCVEHYDTPEVINPVEIAENIPDIPDTREHTVVRPLRNTKLVEQLKLLHGHRCQICGLALELKNRLYSEGHHIQPLGHNGPDQAANILILCPNHHVMCDYGGIKLSLEILRLDSLHNVSPKFVNWHNEYYELNG